MPGVVSVKVYTYWYAEWIGLKLKYDTGEKVLRSFSPPKGCQEVTPPAIHRFGCFRRTLSW